VPRQLTPVVYIHLNRLSHWRHERRRHDVSHGAQVEELRGPFGADDWRLAMMM